MQYLLNIMHRQWLYLNAHIHLQKLDGMTMDENMAVIDLIKHIMLVNPSNLLPCHSSLLKVDFQQLGEDSSINRKLWLTKMYSDIMTSNAQPHSVDPEDDEDPTTTQSAYTRLAFSNYEHYCQHSGIIVTKQSNMAKRVQL